MKLPIDIYDLKARQLPAVIALAPLLLLINDFSSFEKLSKTLAGLGIVYGFAYIGQQIVRDLGKKREDNLYQEWGGKPTTLALRLNDNPVFDEMTIKRYHEKLATIADKKMPTKEEELSDIAKADLVYDSCSNYLRENTRDEKKYKLLFSENISYGFRRNMLGIKSIAIGILFIGVSITSIKYFMHKNYSNNDVIAIVSSVVMLVFWILLVNSNWVKAAGYRYARQLILSCDTLGKSKK